MKARCAVVGCGRVGTSLVIHLNRVGYPLCGVASRSLKSAAKAAEMLPGTPYSTDPAEVTRGADLVFLTTPDDTIAEVAEAIAEAGGFKEGATVLHCSGSLPSTIMATVREAGAFIGSMHPLQSFAGADLTTNPFEGIIMSVEGDEPCVALALALAADLGARGLTIETHAKTMYHAAAVVASNCFVTVQDMAWQFISDAGVSEEDAWSVLGPLIEGTMANIKKVGPVAALTGPIARGDVDTIGTHLEKIAEMKPGLAALYKALCLHTVDIASRKNTLSAEAEEALVQRLTS
ncbi:Rossmann-like and DUF2520 domain-containing protein [Desulfoluna spongiiphila]|uniref:Predicted oxidoreductase, contains short-chain dehydrogenase (SDR) and DUF2520 domains n=1 Tax=Desulfoluna spongiiphila TaxID=419481 RepID=A0A1G5CLU5_9BACT|nr:DUF2520 domain-containing protein [Desulfoluna spongiiphila]SCY03423.1 Predicted oxidoreductase, contains short-chain dehydrogenase (SDR) and DUF2520 domains [Desulfoluna spongiiphila]